MDSSSIKWNLYELCSLLDCDFQIVGNSDIVVTGLQLDNREIKPGDAFFCIEGLQTDGHKFAKGAIQNGASCVFVNHLLQDVNATQIVVKNTRDTMWKIADIFYSSPSKRMNIIGITGTNGKTTITNIVSHVLSFCGYDNATIGTIGININGKPADETKFKYVGRTTPEAYHLQKMFYNFHCDNIDYASIEVSSHSLIQNRTAGINFAITAFTNLTQDHLDYHKTMDDYFKAKALLFSPQYKAKRVICIDDEWGKKIVSLCKKNNDEIITTGFSSEADYNLNNVKVDFPLIGEFNKQNMLISFAICVSLGLKHKDIINALECMPCVPGRMELVKADHTKPKVFIDYSHTPDALKKAIQTLRSECKGNLITVFGCGGDRDSKKRPIMGKIANELSDFCIVTSDNPRNENPANIIKDIVSGMKDDSNFKIEEDREKAIAEAIKISKQNDIILIAGKGHEKTQLIGNKVFHFDDVEIAMKELKKWN